MGGRRLVRGLRQMPTHCTVKSRHRASRTFLLIGRRRRGPRYGARIPHPGRLLYFNAFKVPLDTVGWVGARLGAADWGKAKNPPTRGFVKSRMHFLFGCRAVTSGFTCMTAPIEIVSECDNLSQPDRTAFQPLERAPEGRKVVVQIKFAAVLRDERECLYVSTCAG